MVMLFSGWILARAVDAMQWYKDLAISVRFEISLMGSFCSGAPCWAGKASLDWHLLGSSLLCLILFPPFSFQMLFVSVTVVMESELTDSCFLRPVMHMTSA